MFKFLLLFLFLSQGALGEIRGFCPVAAGLYRGGRPSLADLQQLKAWGVRTIVNLQGGDYLATRYLAPVIPLVESGERPIDILSAKTQAEGLGLDFYNFPLNSLWSVTADEERMIGRVLDLLAQKDSQPFFLHCGKGVDRTGLIVALYRLVQQNWSAADAHAEMVAMGHDKIHRFFTGGLDRYFFKFARDLALAKGEDTAPLKTLECQSLLSPSPSAAN